MKRMLFNATHLEELRVAIVDGQSLIDLDIEFINSENKRGYIYTGRVTKVEPSLEAVFVDYGAARHGFLSLKDISRSYFSNKYSPTTPMAMVRVQDVINVGDTLIVQVDKNERSNKGAALTTFISLAGRYLVLLPNNPRGGGISRQIVGYERKELKEMMSKLDLPDEHSMIARTAGIGQSLESFQTDLKYLVNLWKAIEAKAQQSKAPFLIYEESSLVVRTLRDYLREDVKQVLIDDKEVFNHIKTFVRDMMPNTTAEIKHYNEPEPLYSRFQVEHQIKDAFSRRVQLPNGGEIVIEQTEALVAIDVNSARSTKGADIEETAKRTNLEAVVQIAKQLRIRDIGGLIVIDLIDMSQIKNRRLVEERFLECVESDRARTRINRISQFGLLELSRQRMRSSIEDSSHDTCPRCRGRGSIRNVTSTGLYVLRLIEEEALKRNTELVHAHLPVEVATFLVNEKRRELSIIEQKTKARAVVIPTKALLTPDHRIYRFTSADVAKFDNVHSYTLKLRDNPPQTYNIIHTSGIEFGTSVERDLITLDVSKSSESGLKRFLKKMISPSTSDPQPESVKEAKPTPERTPRHSAKPRRSAKPRSNAKHRSKRSDKDYSNYQGRKHYRSRKKPKPGNRKKVTEGSSAQQGNSSPKKRYKSKNHKHYSKRRGPKNSRSYPKKSGSPNRSKNRKERTTGQQNAADNQ